MKDKLKAIYNVIKGNATVYGCELDMKLAKGMTIERLNSAHSLSVEAADAFTLLGVSLTRNKELYIFDSKMRELPCE